MSDIRTKKINIILLVFFMIIPAFLHAQNDDVDSTEKSWSNTIEADYYFIHDLAKYPTLTFYSDHNSLHLEARYNYEDINTASVFAGYNFEKDGNFSYTLTPMVGSSFGYTKGFLTGLECTASYDNINFYSENEYMLSYKGREDNFFYSWTQLSTPVLKKLELGLSAESLRLYKTKFDVQKGAYAEFSPGNFLIDLYYFNPFSDYDFFVASVSFQF